MMWFELEKWYVGWEIEIGHMYYVHSSSHGIPRYGGVKSIPPIPNHKTVIWTRYITKATHYPARRAIEMFAGQYLRKGVPYVLLQFKSDHLVYMDDFCID